MRTAVSIRVSLIAVAVAGVGLSTPLAHANPEVKYVGETPLKASEPREDAAREMAAGRFDKALALYQIAIERDGTDRIALRDGGRAAFALGKHALAAELLLRASEQMAKPDAELLYLLGEAQWTLGQTAAATATHKRVLAMLGPAPAQRIEKLWAARIHARLGDRAAADAIYADLSAADPADAEAALARAEMHATARDWDAAERAIRGLVAHVPDNKRANEMLAWIYEARGQLADELAIRKKLAASDAGANDVRDYGRALERSGDWAGALHAYRRAAELPEGEHDLELARALQRVEHRMSVEVAAGAIGRSDPSATGIGGFVGAALPFGRASHLAMTVTHEYATSGARDVQSSEVRVAAVLRAAAATAILGTKAGVVNVAADETMQGDRSLFALAPFLAANTGPIAGHVTLAAEGEIGGLWRETPRAVFEAGRSDSIAGHLYISGLRRRLVVDSGVLARKLRLTADEGTPRATQLLAWGGADVLVWSDFARQVRGEILDDELQHSTFSADSFVLGYRHYELIGDTDEMFASRLALADRASIDEASFTLRKVLARGAAAVEARGGFGRDWARELWMGRGALAVWISPTVGSRLSLSFELARESVHALVGERRTGWVNYHVDL
jgi:tetratricopeptide (TPR) repeat protein